jgi:hypothetical protein
LISFGTPSARSQLEQVRRRSFAQVLDYAVKQPGTAVPPDGAKVSAFAAEMRGSIAGPQARLEQRLLFEAQSQAERDADHLGDRQPRRWRVDGFMQAWPRAASARF